MQLDRFRSEIRRRGTLPQNRFLVRFDPPAGLGTGTNFRRIPALNVPLFGDTSLDLSIDNSRQLALRCFSATFPGIQVMTKSDIYRYGYGPVDHVAYGALFGDIQTGFIVDNDGKVEEFFNNWVKLMVNPDSSEGMESATDGVNPYEVEYKDNYVTKMTITKYRETGSRVLRCIVNKCWPVDVGQVQLAWDQTNQYSVLPVTWAYRDHKVVRDQGLDSLVGGLFN